MGEVRMVEAEHPSTMRSTAPEGPSERDDLAAVWGPTAPTDRAPRLLGLFAHPDDEVFCVGGTIARCSDAGAVTGLVSLTQGEAGQIRAAAAATRRTLASVRFKELHESADALGVDHVTCLDLGDGRLSSRPFDELVTTVRALIDDFAPDVVVTFGPDGGFGHPDHVVSCRAAAAAVRTMAEPPRLLQAKFPMHGQLMVDLLVEWLVSQGERFRGPVGFGHALKLFADGTSMLGVAADHIRVEWYPAGSYIIEQGEPSTELFCMLSGTADVVVEHDDGSMVRRDVVAPGSFVGEDGLASGRPRNAHVIARDSVTCLVLAPSAPSASAGRGEGAEVIGGRSGPRDAPAPPDAEDCVVVDARPALVRKVAALAAHRSQYAMEPDLLPLPMLQRLLGTEHFVVAGTADR
jgi:LmbE family N-acetylglucosaminyl deacetylase